MPRHIHVVFGPFRSHVCLTPPHPRRIISDFRFNVHRQPRDRPRNGINSGEVSTGGPLHQGGPAALPIQAQQQASTSAKPGVSRTSHIFPFNAGRTALAPNFVNDIASSVMQGRLASMPPPSAGSAIAVAAPRFCAGLAVQPASTEAYASSSAGTPASSSRAGFAVRPASAAVWASGAAPPAMAAGAQPATTAPRRGRPKGRKNGQSSSKLSVTPKTKTKSKPKSKAKMAATRALLSVTDNSAVPSAPRRGRPPKKYLEDGGRVASESRIVSRKITKKKKVPASTVAAAAAASRTTRTPIKASRERGRQRTTVPKARGGPTSRTAAPATG